MTENNEVTCSWPSSASCDMCTNPTLIDRILGQNLKNIRRLRNLTQEEFGNLIQISAQQIQKYEKGTNAISAAKIAELSRLLNLPITVFYYGLHNLKFHGLEESEVEYTFEDESPIQNMLTSQNVSDSDFNEYMRVYLLLNPFERKKLIKMFKIWIEDLG